MKYVDALAALAIMLLFAPILSAQYIRADATWRKSIETLRQISQTKERINKIEELHGNQEAFYFVFEGQELHWILGRQR